MTTPDNFKSLRIPPELHARLAALQDTLPHVNSMWQTVEHLMAPECVRVPMMPGQLPRWEEAAALTGMPLPVWIVARVEGALLYGADRGSIELIYRHVRSIDQKCTGAARPFGPDQGISIP